MGPRAKKASLFLLLGGALTVTCSTEGCRNATQMELDVTFAGLCKDLTGGVAFIVSTDPYAAESRIETNVFTTTTHDCTQVSPTEAHVGTLVVTPSSDTDHTSIVVLAGFGIPVEQCKMADGYFGCIVARRGFSFVPHTGLSLDISLDPDCLNVPCSAVSTCSHKTCVDSNVDCTEDGCGKVGVLADGGAALADAPTSSDAYVQQLDGPHGGDDGGPSDAGIHDGGKDAAAEAGTDGGSCTGSNNVPVTCMTNGGGSKACTTAGTSCCYSAVISTDGGTDSGAAGYDCRGSGSCLNAPPNADLRCRGSMNCPVGQQCCFNFQGFAGGTYCASSCPTDGGVPAIACTNGCECGGRTCSAPATVGMSPAQSILLCQ